MSILIADGGSTKIDWTVVSGISQKTFRSPGINPVLWDIGKIEQMLQEGLPHEILSNVESVYFYGAGCLGRSAEKMQEALMRVVAHDAEIEVESDLLGAARALFGNERGIACILGTGSNSALYDGKEIISNIHPLGYILGDEGSGASIGKHFLNALYKGRLPESLRKDFETETGLTYDDVIDHVYRQPMANKFLASLVIFVSKRRKECAELLNEEFENFIEKDILPYNHCELPVGIVGGVGYEFHDELKEIFLRHRLKLNKVVAKPMENLVDYHLRMVKGVGG
ncbi:MAG: ATPase [Prevotella sp.]|nr:ATPase [Prevotella sp.]